MKVVPKFTFGLGLLTSVVLATLLSARSADYRQRANWAKRNTYEKLMRELNELEPGFPLRGRPLGGPAPGGDPFSQGVAPGGIIC